MQVTEIIDLEKKKIFKTKLFSGHGEANGVGGAHKKRKRSESLMEIDNPSIARPNKK